MVIFVKQYMQLHIVQFKIFSTFLFYQITFQFKFHANLISPDLSTSLEIHCVMHILHIFQSSIYIHIIITFTSQIFSHFYTSHFIICEHQSALVNILIILIKV